MKFAYIMRGIPGSGKSTTAKQLAHVNNYSSDMIGKPYVEDNSYYLPIQNLDFSTTILSAIHSTDQFFMVENKYVFEKEMLQKYHNENFANFKKSLEREIPIVICDNTNSTIWEFNKYFVAATRAGYLTAIVEMPHPSVEDACKRNTHGVPGDIIKKMLKRWESWTGKP